MGLCEGLYGLVDRHAHEYGIGAVVAVGDEGEFDAELTDALWNLDLEVLRQGTHRLERHLLDGAANRRGVLVVLAVIQVYAEPPGQRLVHAAGQ